MGIASDMGAGGIVHFIFLVQIYVYALVCPFTKVEESFNVQAFHDILNYGVSQDQILSNYDHLSFPGVVPRTFVGPLVISFIVKLFQLPHTLLACRLVLGTLVWLSIMWFQRSVNARCGKGVQFWTGVCYICQFHLPYYASRPLPNTFAFVLVTLALAEWLHPMEKYSRFKAVCLLGLTISIFRCDVLLLTAFIGLQIVLGKSLFILLAYGLCGFTSLIFGAALSVLVDSYFWRRVVWPEGEVFHFNVIENKSGNYGKFPFHWYFLIALPKMLLAIYPLFLLSSVHFRQYFKSYATPVLLFVLLYSFLPHKEVRFIFYVIPMFSLGAGMVLAELYGANGNRTEKKTDAKYSSKLRLLFKLGVLIMLSGSFLISIGFTAVSSYNYPGGYALQRLHENYPPGTVFIDTMTTMDGVSRFAERKDWNYVKETPTGKFDYLVIGVPNENKGLDLSDKKHLFSIEGFRLSRFTFEPRTRVYSAG